MKPLERGEGFWTAVFGVAAEGLLPVFVVEDAAGLGFEAGWVVLLAGFSNLAFLLVVAPPGCPVLPPLAGLLLGLLLLLRCVWGPGLLGT